LASGRGARPSLALTLVGAGMLLAVGYPLAAARAVEAFGPRAVGAALLALGLAGVVLSRRRSIPGFGLWLRVLAVGLPGLALLAGDARFLALVPAAIQAVLCGLFLGSLRGGSSILAQAARTLEPYAPDFIDPYCRKATLAFAALFALQSVALATLGVAAPGPGWALRASFLIWVPTLVAAAIEFLVRKAWFRNYSETPWDRVLRVLFPPENTAQGRRSLDWIRRKRAELGLPPPGFGRRD
jgi:uncharacterized membrane protein